MPGSPPREQNYDANKPGSRVILKGPAWERLLEEEASRAYEWILGLIGEAEAQSAEHRLVSRYVLTNVNTAGGIQEVERLEKIEGREASAAKTVAAKCREILAYVLDRLDERGYWCGWGFDQEVKQRREMAADRRKASVLATEEDALEAISAYYRLMKSMDRTSAAAEVATSEHMDCSVPKVRKAVSRHKAREEGAA
jgi:hypothetical protein